MTGSHDVDTDERERMIRELLARRGLAAVRPSGGVVPRPAGAPVPLSPLQEGIWFLDRLDPGNPAYLLCTSVRLTGHLDAAVLTAEATALVGRHEALRTSFQALDGRAMQVVHEPGELADRPLLIVDDLGQVPPADREDLATRITRSEIETGFDLGRCPLLRIRLIRFTDHDHLMTISTHHIVSDERSLSLLLGELLDGVERRGPGRRGDPATVAAPPVQFPDYVLWQRDRLDGGLAAEQRRFWAGQLAGTSGVLDLPTDRPRPAVQTFAGATRAFALTPELTAGVDALARRSGCTRFMIALAALSIVLHRWTRQDDICIGSPVSARATPQLESMVGLLVNSVVFRTNLAGDPDLGEVLRRIRDTCLDTLDNADLPLDQVVEQARLTREPGRNPLFQVMCVVNPAGGVRHGDKLTARPVGFGRRTSRMDLTLMLWETEPALTGIVDYNTDLFDESTVDRLIDRFRLALRALAIEPARRLRDVDLAGGAERRDLDSWNDTARDYPPARGLHQIIRDRAVAAPDAVAVLDGPVTLSYRELDLRADRLAGRLRAAGVGPEVPVGLALPTGGAAIIGLLGILKAGGAYLPLNPGHPSARLRALLDDARAPVTVTSPAYQDRLVGYAGTLVLIADPAAGSDATAGSDEAAGSDAKIGKVPDTEGGCDPDQLAYIIYTSGSTGSPKGVMVSHRSAGNLAYAFAELHGISPGDRLLMLPPLSFDASVGDIFPALVSGATLVTHPRPAELTGAGLLRFCTEHDITLVDAAAALWIRWTADLAADSTGEPVMVAPGLRALMIGGEAAPTATAREWARTTGRRITIHNHYGPTEATVCATTYATVDAAELPGVTHLPIGRPLPNVRVHLLDQMLRPVPVGATGEVYLGGAAPARGYLGAPGLTAQRFVPDPFGSAGARLYRSGDLGRYRSDGTVEFLGRTDRQVKIRGHRVDAGEVEAACASQPGVARAAVVVRDDGTGARLVGYLVPATGATPQPAAVRSALRRLLPDYLVPAAIVILPELPLTAHGKLDHHALPAPGGNADRTPPGTPTERVLGTIWADLLGGVPVGARDNFFDLGGHSLLAGPLVARIATGFGIELPLRAVFETADLADLAARIDTARKPVPPAPRAGPRATDDARLPDDICANLPAQAPAPVPDTVLITGATGFLGAHLVADWLRQSRAELHCLVRAGSAESAVQRVRENLLRYGLWRDRYADRLIGVPGDLAEPRLGLERRDFDRLADTVDAVVHNGGVVNFLLPYESLRAANVAGTTEVLRLAGTGRPTAVHLVSTLGVFLTPARQGAVVTERDAPDDPTGLGDGYNATKWVADARVRAARRRGLALTVHRPARITGHHGTGVGNAEDYFSRLLKTFVQLGAAPEILDDHADLAPVDHVAAGIGQLSRDPAHRGQDFHYYNNHTISFPDLAGALRSYGYPVVLLPYHRWRATLLARPDAALAPFAPLFGPTVPTRTQPVFDCAATEAALAAAGIVCPPADAALIHTYLAWYVRTGVLAPPPAAGSTLEER